MKTCPRCGACFDDPFDLCAYDGGLLDGVFAGPRVLAGRYVLEQRVAAGAMGTIFRAVHLQVGSTVAVKLMQPKSHELQIGLARFRREAQVLGQIKHPNAVLVMDFGVESRGVLDVPFLVTEFLSGEPLSMRLRDNLRMDVATTEAVLSPLCEAVHEAHEVGIIHRDLKPSNIFIEKLRDGSEVVKVLDFGIAKFVEAAPGFLDELMAEGGGGISTSGGGDLFDEMSRVQAQDVTRPGQAKAPQVEASAVSAGTLTDAGFMVGTIPYMAPEQMTGDPVSRQSDVFALASMLFRMLSGHLPFTGSDDEIIAAKLQGPRPSLRAAGAPVSLDLDRVVQQALDVDPRKRPGDIRVLSQALRQEIDRGRQLAPPRSGIDLAMVLDALARACRRLQTELNAAAENLAADEIYRRVRDRMLALERPLQNGRRMVGGLSASLDDDERQLLREARQTCEQAIAPVSRSLHLLTQGQADEYGDYLQAMWARVQRLIAALLQRCADLDDNPWSQPVVTRPHNPFAADGSTDPEPLDDLAELLDAEDPLDRAEAFDRLLQRHGARLQQALCSTPVPDDARIERLVRGLWRRADLLLLMELYPSHEGVRLLPALASLDSLPAAAPFVALARLYGGKSEGEATARLGISGVLSQLSSPEDKRVMQRCLLPHPVGVVRQQALRESTLSELWDFVIYPRTPVELLLGIFEQARHRAQPEYLKVFFFCVHDRLSAVVEGEDLHAALKLMRQFFAVPCFHEDVVFEPLLDLEQSLRERSLAMGQDILGAQAYDEELADFVAQGSVVSTSLINMREVPLPVQRKLAREGRFVLHFACHPNERVALETVRHLLRRESIVPVLRLPTLHRAVLTELSHHRRFFRKLGARLALLGNPKTTVKIARPYLPLIGDENVRQLAANKHINADVRALARTYWSRLKRRRTSSTVER